MLLCGKYTTCLKNIDITYHNVCEIVRQLQEKQIGERDEKVDESVEEMDEVD